MVAIANAVFAPVSRRPMAPSLGSSLEGCAGGDAPGEDAEDDDADHARGGDAAE